MNGTTDWVLLTVALGSVGVLVLGAFLRHGIECLAEIRYVKGELQRCQYQSERMYWRRELRLLQGWLFTGIQPDTLRRWFCKKK